MDVWNDNCSSSPFSLVIGLRVVHGLVGFCKSIKEAKVGMWWVQPRSDQLSTIWGTSFTMGISKIHKAKLMLDYLNNFPWIIHYLLPSYPAKEKCNIHYRVYLIKSWGPLQWLNTQCRHHYLSRLLLLLLLVVCVWCLRWGSAAVAQKTRVSYGFIKPCVRDE